MIAKEEIGERTTETTTYRKRQGSVREDGTGEERSTFDRRKDKGKEGSESRCDRRKFDKGDDYSKKGVKRKRAKKERNNKEGSNAGKSAAW